MYYVIDKFSENLLHDTRRHVKYEVVNIYSLFRCDLLL